MTGVISIFAAMLLIAGLIWLFIAMPARKIANILADGAPILISLVGGILTVLGRGIIGIPMLALGLAWWLRLRNVRRKKRRKSLSIIRAASVELEFNRDFSQMDGRILIGQFEGKLFSNLNASQLLDFHKTVMDDFDSIELFEAYLDRRLPVWRKNTDTRKRRRKTSSTSSGAMTEEEAYQILGLEAGASPDEVNHVWSVLMEGANASGGSSGFLATKINAAKDILVT